MQIINYIINDCSNSAKYNQRKVKKNILPAED